MGKRRDDQRTFRLFAKGKIGSRVFKEKQVLSNWFVSQKIKIEESSVHGLGVFAKEHISKYEVIERAPAITFARDLLFDWLHDTESRHILHDHAFGWPDGRHGICLGYGSVYNHSNDNNAKFRYINNKTCQTIEFVAVRDIQPGEEIFTHYIRGGQHADFTAGGSLVAEGQLTGLEMAFLKSV